MKFFTALTLIVLCIHSANAQTEEYLSIEKIEKKIENGTGITAKTLCSSVWKVNTSIMQLVYDNPKDNMKIDMEYSSSYTFHEDGTFEVDATLDSDGKWELRNNGKLLYLYNNLRKDEELHHILMDGNTMKWFYIEDKSLFYQYLNKI